MSDKTEERHGFEKAKRRARIYTGRIAASLTKGGIKQNCLFLHLPKCGGTSLSEALYAAVPMHKHIGVIDAVSSRRAASLIAHDKDCLLQTHEDMEGAAATFDLREKIMIAYMCAGKRLIHGHVLFSDTAFKTFKDDYKIVTVMRDPVKRALSNFHMNVANSQIANDPDAWLNDIQGLNHASVNLRYFSGEAKIKDSNKKQCLKKAHDNLEKIHLIGFLNEMDVFLDRFKDQFGTRPKVHRYNKAKGEPMRLSDDQMKRLKELCAPDIELYKAAYKKFGVKPQPY